MSGDRDATWLVKDFNVLYRVTRDLLLAVGEGDESKTARALDAVAAQLTRLVPAYTFTEAIRLSMGIARGLNPDVTREDLEAAIAAVEQAKARGS